MELILGALAMLSSVAAALFGLGGGLILISFLPDFLPAGAIIPVHGVTQLASNAGRALFSYRTVQFRLLPKFLVGSLFGAALFGMVVVTISTEYIPLFIGLYILIKLWSERAANYLSRLDSFLVLGFLQTGLGILVGSTGQLTLPRLMKEFPDRDKVVSTSGMFMTLSHSLKILTYGFIGFHFSHYGVLLLYMVCGALLGSFLGTLLRKKISNRAFNPILKALLTVLALKMIFSSLW